MAQDLYVVLGLSKGASDAEIKKAYRRLAREYHPDVNKAADAETRFKEIQKSYDILSDAQKKSNYDQFGVTDDSPGAGAGGFGGGFEGGFGDSFEDIFDVFFGGGQRRSRGGNAEGGSTGARRGEDLRYDMELTLEEVATGVSREIDIFHLEKCSRCEGSGAQPGTAKTTCSTCKGAGKLRTVQRTMLGSFSQVVPCHHCNGSGSIVKNPCLLCHGHGIEKAKKRIKVQVPAGVDNGTRLRVSGEGNAGEGGGPAGDLYVFIAVKNHKYFQRRNDDLFMEVEIPYTKAALGTEMDVPILDGKASLKIPAGTQPNTILKLKGKGIPHLKGYGRGDQHVAVKLSIPHNLSSKEKELLEQLDALRTTDKSSKNIFDYVKSLF